MGLQSLIEWTDDTLNPWQVCTKVSPACANCYMFSDLKRYGRETFRSGVPHSKPTAPLAQFWHLPADQVQTTASIVQQDGDLLCLGGESAIVTTIQIGAVAPVPPTDDIPVKGVLRGKTLILELP